MLLVAVGPVMGVCRLPPSHGSPNSGCGDLSRDVSPKAVLLTPNIAISAASCGAKKTFFVGRREDSQFCATAARAVVSERAGKKVVLFPDHLFAVHARLQLDETGTPPSPCPRAAPLCSRRGGSAADFCPDPIARCCRSAGAPPLIRPSSTLLAQLDSCGAARARAYHSHV